MWDHQYTLDHMHGLIRRMHSKKPRVDYCTKTQLEELWQENLYQLNLYHRIVEKCEDSEEERVLLKKIEWIEAELDSIDYEWSRF